MVLTQPAKSKWTKSYRLEYFKAAPAEDNSGSYFAFSAVVAGGKEPRKSYMKLYSDEIEAGAPVSVSCTCTYFRIKLAIPLAVNGSTEVNVRRSDIPDKYRGIQAPGLCPHLLLLSETILSQNNTEVERLRNASKRTNINAKLKSMT